MPLFDLTKNYKKIDQQIFNALPYLHRKNLLEYENNFTVYRKHVFSLIDVFKDIDKVDDNIWIGTVLAATDVVKMRELGITHILNMALDEEYFDYNDVEDIHVTRIGIYDGHLSPNNAFTDAAAHIAKVVGDGGNILVHCSAGVSRSSTAVITYLMLHRGMQFSDALKKLQQERIVISPHPLLVRSLIRDLKDQFIW